MVGLGNPGPQYAETRHNLGFMVLDHLSSSWKQDKKSLLSQLGAGSSRVHLLKPQTYMNLSGEAVRPVLDFYQLKLEQVLIVCDDFALPLGRMRIRAKGSSGGHNGLTSVAQHLGGWDFPRLRLGIGPVPKRWETADFVLARFSPNERKVVQAVVEAGADAVLTCLRDGLDKAQSRFNGLDLSATD